MTRRPATITGIGWLFIVVGAAGVLKDVLPLVTSDDPRRLATLKSDGLGELGAAWTSRLLAIIGGAGLLRGRNRARWLLVVWMVFHIGLSFLHSLPELLGHGVIFAPILYLLFGPASHSYFHADTPARLDRAGQASGTPS